MADASQRYDRDDRTRGYYDYTDPTLNAKNMVESAVGRIDDLREAEIKRIDQLMALREAHAEKIRELESNRLNAIRQVDVLASQTLAASLERAVQALATNTARDAETLRSLVTAAAQTVAAQRQVDQTFMTERIASLEKASYRGEGGGQGRRDLWGWIIAALAIGVAIATLIKH